MAARTEGLLTFVRAAISFGVIPAVKQTRNQAIPARKLQWIRRFSPFGWLPEFPISQLQASPQPRYPFDNHDCGYSVNVIWFALYFSTLKAFGV